MFKRAIWIITQTLLMATAQAASISASSHTFSTHTTHSTGKNTETTTGKNTTATTNTAVVRTSISAGNIDVSQATENGTYMTNSSSSLITSTDQLSAHGNLGIIGTTQWKEATFGLIGACFVFVLVIVIGAIFMFKLKRTLRKCSQTLYPMATKQEINTYTDTKSTKSITAVKLELQSYHATDASLHDEEVDSPTLVPSPTPPPSLPPSLGRAVSEAPAVPQRGNRQYIPVKVNNASMDNVNIDPENTKKIQNKGPNTVSSRNTETADGNKKGIAKDVIVAALTGQMENQNAVDEDEDSDPYESYENIISVRTSMSNLADTPDTNNANMLDPAPYEEPISTSDRAARTFSTTEEFIKRQCSLSGLPAPPNKPVAALKSLRNGPLHVEDEETYDNEEISQISTGLPKMIPLLTSDNLQFSSNTKVNKSNNISPHTKIKDTNKSICDQNTEEHTDDDDIPIYEDEPVVDEIPVPQKPVNASSLYLDVENHQQYENAEAKPKTELPVEGDSNVLYEDFESEISPGNSNERTTANEVDINVYKLNNLSEQNSENSLPFNPNNDSKVNADVRSKVQSFEMLEQPTIGMNNGNPQNVLPRVPPRRDLVAGVLQSSGSISSVKSCSGSAVEHSTYYDPDVANVELRHGRSFNVAPRNSYFLDMQENTTELQEEILRKKSLPRQQDMVKSMKAFGDISTWNGSLESTEQSSKQNDESADVSEQIKNEQELIFDDNELYDTPRPSTHCKC